MVNVSLVTEHFGTAPQFSVCIPSYKSEQYIRATVLSVVGQTFPNWELVVTEDHSPDGSWETLQRLVAELNDPRIRIEKNPARLGMVGNWNLCVKHSRAPYVKLLCSDDFLLPDALEREYEAFTRNPGIAVVAAPRQVVNEEGKKLFIRSGLKPGSLWKGRDAIRKTVLSGTNAIGDPVVVSFRRRDFDLVEGFDPRAVYCTDLDLWVRLLLHGDLQFLEQPTGFYRLRQGATGPSVRHLTVDDFVGMSKRIGELSGEPFTPLELRMVRTKSWLLNWVRQAIYRFLAAG